MSFLKEVPDHILAECRIFESDSMQGLRVVIPGTVHATKRLIRDLGFFCVSDEGGALTYQTGEDVNLENWAKYPVFLELPDLSRLVFYEKDGQLEFDAPWRRGRRLEEAKNSTAEEVISKYRSELWWLFRQTGGRSAKFLAALFNNAPAHMWLASDEVIMEVLRETPGFLGLIPFSAMRGKFFEIALQSDGEMLRLLPKSYSHELNGEPVVRKDAAYLMRLYEMALQQNGKALRFIPKEARSYDLCKIAVSQDGAALQWVPEDLRIAHFDLCLMAVRSGANSLDMLSFIPVEHHTQELLQTLVTSNGFLLAQIPQDRVTYDLCFAALFSEPRSFERIPVAFRDEELMLTAVTLRGGNLAQIPPSKRRSRQICHAAVRSDGLALAQVPADLRDFSICMTACNQAPEALFFVPDELKREVVNGLRRHGQNPEAVIALDREVSLLTERWGLDRGTGCWQEAVLDSVSPAPPLEEGALLERVEYLGNARPIGINP